MTNEKLAQLIAEIKNDIIHGMDEFNFPGFSIAIVSKEGILWSEGFGYTDELKTTKVTPDTLFLIGSLSKAYNVMGFLRAMQKGKIHLDDPLRKYYPEFNWHSRFGSDEVDKITFRHLLTHYAGLPHFTATKAPESDKFYSFNEYIERIGDSWQLYPVGTRISYSNAGVDLAAYVLQRISGVSYAEYIEKEVYQPLGMKRSLVEPAEALKRENHAKGFIGTRQATSDEMLVPWLGAGAQFSSVNDMAQFLMMHFNKGLVGSERFLEEEFLEEMYKIPFPDKYELTKIGLGIGIAKNNYGGELELRFFGDGPGYVNLHHFFPNLGIGWLVQINQNQNVFPFLFKLAGKVGPALVEYILGEIPKPITIDSQIELPAKIELAKIKLQRLEGKYISRMDDIEVKLNEEKLVVILEGNEFELVPHSENQFSSEKLPVVEFEYNETGRPVTIKIVEPQGRVTYYDYDSGPLDERGPNRNAWKKLNSIYRADYTGVSLYSSTVVKNGHLYLATNLGNKLYRLYEYKDNLFFTADGQSVKLNEEQLILPGLEFIIDDISISKIKALMEEEKENIQIKKESLEGLMFIYEATEQKNNLEQLKEIYSEK
ncbi:MAG: beta-lactamase family protein [Candidatus Heimdallarchaeota archaeon]|nr:beta-lactamase family protein [Candidatus Heimdallarchaeota archaeon]